MDGSAMVKAREKDIVRIYPSSEGLTRGWVVDCRKFVGDNSGTQTERLTPSASLVTLVLETAMSRSTISRPLPDLDYLRQCLSYDPESGALTWKRRPREHFKNDGAWRYCNNLLAGRSAGSVTPKGYITIHVAGGNYPAHRIAWLIHYGKEPKDQIDHVDQIKSNNALCNLREATNTDNQRNTSLRKNSSSGVTGVTWYRPTGKWLATIRANGKRIHLGYFSNKKDAEAARSAAAEKLGFSPLHGQTPPAQRKPSGSDRSGVNFHVRVNRWYARMYVDGKRLYLGCFVTKEEALAARKAAEIRYGVADRVLSGSGAPILPA